MIAGCADLGAEAEGLDGGVMNFEVFGDDGSVPGASTGGDEAGDEVGEDAGQDEGGPVLEAGKAEQAGDLAEVGRNSHGTGDDVEEDVPLSSEEHEGDGAETKSHAELHEPDDNEGEQSRSGEGCGDLSERLRDIGQLWMEADGDADGDGPEACDEEGGVDAEESHGGAGQQGEELVCCDAFEQQDGVESEDSG